MKSKLTLHLWALLFTSLIAVIVSFKKLHDENTSSNLGRCEKEILKNAKHYTLKKASKNGKEYVVCTLTNKTDWDRIYTQLAKKTNFNTKMKTNKKMTFLIAESRSCTDRVIIVGISNDVIVNYEKESSVPSLSEFYEYSEAKNSKPESSNSPISTNSNQVQTSYISIVIDDCGYLPLSKTEEWLKSGIPFTFAVIPFTPHDREFARTAYMNGYEILIHAPMEALKQKGEPWQIKSYDSTQTIISKTDEFVKRLLPFAIGMNNHMGSKATASRRVMKAIGEVLKKYGLFFLDSLTTSDSVAYSEMKSLGVPSLKRDVFLDNEQSKKYITRQLWKMTEIALKRGYAIGIGHIQTRELLESAKEWREEIKKLNIKLVPLSYIYAEVSMKTAMFNN